MARTYHLSEARREERPQRMKHRRADPEFAARNAAAGRETLQRLNADPEFAARNAAEASERMKRHHANPEVTAQVAEGAIKSAGYL